METPVLLIGPVVVIGALLILPFAFGEGESFTHLAEYTPWIPAMDAWSADSSQSDCDQQDRKHGDGPSTPNSSFLRLP